MKLLNYTTTYFAGVLLVIITTWAAVFYYAMLDQIYDSIDDGLDNQKGLIIQKAAGDSSILRKRTFEEGDYAIREIPSAVAIDFKDVYIDTSMYMQNEDDFEPVRLLKTVFVQNGRYYQLQVTTSMVEEDDLSRELLSAIILLYLGLVVTILVLNNFLLKKIWQPFYHLVKQLKKFRLDQPGPLVTKPTRIAEFRLLNETMQRVLQGNVDAYSSQKHFIENASHELQTPLAISIARIETLAADPGLTVSQQELVTSAMDNLERLTRLNRSLLLLFKIENRQFSEETEVDIGALVKHIAEDFSDQLTYYNVQLDVEEEAACIQKMNTDLAIILITNLIKNAIIHNHKGGYVQVKIAAHSLIVRNSGRTTPLDAEKIFNRFYKATPGPSMGLGLAIVKKIVEIYHFQVPYHFDDAHTMTIHFSR